MPAHPIRPTVSALLSIVLFTYPLVAPVQVQDRGQQILDMARAAIGQAPGGAPLTSLTARATVRRVATVLKREMSSEVDVEFMLPGRYRRSESISLGGVSRTVTTALSGESFLYDDAGAAALMGMDPSAPGPRREQAIREMKKDATRLMAVWLLSPPPGCTVSSGGVAEAPDGKADIVDLVGDEDFSLRLFLDVLTHRLLMATYRAEIVALDAETVERIKAGAIRASGGDPKKLGQSMHEAMERLPKKTVAVVMRFAEFKTVQGLSLPHVMQVETEGQGHEEWTIASFKVNPPLSPERFEKK